MKQRQASSTKFSVNEDWTDEKLRRLSIELEDLPPIEILRWANSEFGKYVALSTGFGAEGCVLISMLSQVNPEARIFYLDTDLLFRETYELKNALEKKYDVKFERRATKLSLELQAEKYGERLWERQPDLCCKLRKVEPLKDMLSGLSAWITAIRRDQSPARASSEIFERDKKFGLIKINPLAGWTSRDVWKYIIVNDVPYNPLHDLSYPSIGCAPCTAPVKIGEDPRSGRWQGTAKTECGLHQ